MVLIRALEPVEGISLMEQRRKGQNRIGLCNGPGKLCAALGITKAQYGLDLCGDELYIAEYRQISKEKIRSSPRINIDYAEKYRDCPWRYYIEDNPYVSKVPNRYRGE